MDDQQETQNNNSIEDAEEYEPTSQELKELAQELNQELNQEQDQDSDYSDDLTELLQKNPEENKKAMLKLVYSYVMKESLGEAIKLISTWRKDNYTNITILEQNTNDYNAQILAHVGDPPKELLGKIRVVVGLPIIKNVQGKAKNTKKIAREVGDRIIEIWNCDLEDFVDPQVYTDWYYKAMDEQIKFNNLDRIAKERDRLLAREEIQKQEQANYNSMTPREKLVLKKQELTNQRSRK